MKLQILIGALMVCVATQPLAAELPDCNLDAVIAARRFLERLRPTAEAASYLNVAAKLRNGERLTFSEDDTVIVADVKVTTSRQALFASTDLIFKASWVADLLRARRSELVPIAALRRWLVRQLSRQPRNRYWADVETAV